MNMKNTKKNFGIILLSIALMAGACASSKNSAHTGKMRTIVESKNFIFRPDAILPSPATAQRLDLATGRFSVTVSNGTLSADLPFIGESVASTVGRDEQNIKFTTTDFSFDTNPKSNHWDITIRPKNQQQVSDLVFNVSDNGTATLRVNSNTRQAVSFSGYFVSAN
jgi:hypothetical protein